MKSIVLDMIRHGPEEHDSRFDKLVASFLWWRWWAFIALLAIPLMLGHLTAARNSAGLAVFVTWFWTFASAGVWFEAVKDR